MSKASDLAKELNGVLGSGTVKLGSDPYFAVTYLPTNVFPIDVLLQGGLPRGRSVEIYGDFSTLKTWIALKAIARTQKDGGVCTLIDTENTFDPQWAESCGVDVDSLIMQQPRTGEEAVDLTEVAVSNDVDLVVWDSVAATLPQDEAKKRMSKENIQPARLAALMSAGMRKITSANGKTALLFINQTRINVGITFGSNEAIPGGRALGFYASYRLSLRKAGRIREDVQTYEDGKRTKVKQTTAFRIRATLEKSKLSAPYRDVMLTYDLRLGELDEIDYLINVGLEHGLIIHKDKSPTWTMGTKKVSGAEAFAGWLRTNQQAQMKIKELVVPSGVASPVKRKVVIRRRQS